MNTALGNEPRLLPDNGSARAVALHLPVWSAVLRFRNRHLREQPALLTGQSPTIITPGGMSYDLRRLRLHGMIERFPRTHRYRVYRLWHVQDAELASCNINS